MAISTLTYLYLYSCKDNVEVEDRTESRKRVQGGGTFADRAGGRVANYTRDRDQNVTLLGWLPSARCTSLFVLH